MMKKMNTNTQRHTRLAFAKDENAPNKALKLARVARWTPSTGAASQYRAGFSRRLALR